MPTFLAILGFIICMLLVSWMLSQTVFKNSQGCGGNCYQGRRPCDCQDKQ